MKRALRVFGASLAVLILLFAVTGCVQRRVPKEVELEYTAFEAVLYDCMDGGNHSLEFSPWATEKVNSHQDTTAPLEVAVTFNGVKYVGTYVKSRTRTPNFYKVHRYKSTNEAGHTIYFEINAETGALTTFQFFSTESVRAKLDEEKGRTVADAIADDYLNLADYQAFASKSEDNEYCRYTYYREINGIKLADQLEIVLDGNGEVTFFGTTSLGSFRGIDTVAFDEAKAKLAIEEKLDVIYADDARTRQYEITDKILIRMTDGNFAILYTIDNRFEKVDGEVTIKSGSQVQLLVTAQPKDATP